jgi:SAM-dependent methyltransferase
VLTNGKPASAIAHGPAEPSPWVRRFLPLLRPGGRALDLAAGAGRHSRFLLDHGYRVTAVDRDIAALAGLAADPRLTIRALDLESGEGWRLGSGWDAIVVTNYLHRPLLPALAPALAPEGVLIYETFALGNERLGKPSNPDFLLRPGELLAIFAPLLTVIAFEEGRIERPRPAVVQRLAAIRGVPPAAVALP